MLKFWNSLPILIQVGVVLLTVFVVLLSSLVVLFRAGIELDRSLDPGHYKRRK